MSRYKQYECLKDSDIAWLGKIPESWQLKRFKNIFQIRKRIAGELGHQVLSITQRGIKVKDVESGDGQLSMDYSKYQLVYKNDFAMNHMDLLTGYVDISNFEGVTSPDYRVFTLFEENSYDRYFLYLLQLCYIAKIFYPLGQGAATVGRWRLPTEAFTEFLSPLPSFKEQKAIADFLDHETTKIDTLIAKQQELIKLLKEKRQAVISHAVTKGLNPNAPMRDSGVEWLGEVPEHWDVLQIRRILDLMEQGKSPECESRPAEIGEWGVLKTSCVNQAKYQSDENKFLPEHIAPFPQYEVRGGDVLMSRASGSIDLIGSVAYVYETPPRILMSDKIFRLNISEKINRIFFTYLMQSSYVRSLIEVSISGAEGMANNITKTAVLGFKFSMPPLSEQNEIVDYLRKRTTQFDQLLNQTEQAVSKLQERRTALISAAVTGKIDVRDWQAPCGTALAA
ncbi:MAG: restriction endonuclease subunit S [Undibacterium umbellatum]|uniref:restriction endonuclease subunit S n=1 Tax=Undibacterium umbellatum TaxID=2762300 RepID=UPI003BB497A4